MDDLITFGDLRTELKINAPDLFRILSDLDSPSGVIQVNKDVNPTLKNSALVILPKGLFRESQLLIISEFNGEFVKLKFQILHPLAGKFCNHDYIHLTLEELKDKPSDILPCIKNDHGRLTK